MQRVSGDRARSHRTHPSWIGDRTSGRSSSTRSWASAPVMPNPESMFLRFPEVLKTRSNCEAEQSCGIQPEHFLLVLFRDGGRRNLGELLDTVQERHIRAEQNSVRAGHTHGTFDSAIAETRTASLH